MIAPIDVSNTVIKTERLTLRPWRLKDLDDLYEYARDPQVGPNAGWPPHESRDTSVMILLKFIEEKKTFAIEYEGKVIGSIGVERFDEERFPRLRDKKCRELGFVLARPYWGRGLMPEAVDAVVRWLFEENGLDAVLCGHFLFNDRSARVQEKCGFEHLDFGSVTTATGTHEDEMTILWREDWELKNSK